MAKIKVIIAKQVLASLVLMGAKIQNEHGEYTVEVDEGSENHQILMDAGAKEMENPAG